MKSLTQHLRRLLAVTAVLAAALPAASADTVVFDNGPPDPSTGNNMGFAWQADDFSLASSTNLSSINFWSLEAAGAYRGSISWSIVGDNGGMPTGTVFARGTTSNVGRTDMGDAGGLEQFSNTFAFDTPVSVGAGTFWLVLHNGTFDNLGDPNEFLWESTAANATMTGVESYDGGLSWTGNFNEHAFQVSAVPEPASVLLLASGMLVVAGALRRREQGRGQAR